MTTVLPPAPGRPGRHFEWLAHALATMPSHSYAPDRRADPGRGSIRRHGLLIERVDEIDSTSTALLERPALVDDAAAAALAADGHDPDAVGAVWLIAGHQTGGRGRRGRQWRSDPAASLAASLAIEAPLPPEAGALTLVAGAAVARTLMAYGTRPALKWPNDLYLQAADGSLSKAGGILCESRIIGATGATGLPSVSGVSGGPGRPAWRLVVGCGLNLFPSAAVLASAPAAGLDGPPPGHLFEHADPALRERLEVALGAALASALLTALRDGPAAGLADWKAFDLLTGQAVRIHRPDAPGEARVEEAIVRGIDDSGRLLVSDAADPDRCRALIAEEVSIRRLVG